MTFGELIARERQRQHRSCRNVALAAGLSPSALFYLENGVTRDPRFSLVCALLRTLMLSFVSLEGIDDLPVPLALRRPVSLLLPVETPHVEEVCCVNTDPSVAECHCGSRRSRSDDPDATSP